MRSLSDHALGNCPSPTPRPLPCQTAVGWRDTAHLCANEAKNFVVEFFWRPARGTRYAQDCTAILKEGDFESNKQIHADMEILGEFLCLLLRHSALSGKDLRHAALGADHWPEIFRG